MMGLLFAVLATMAPWMQGGSRITGTVSTAGEPGRPLARAYVSLTGSASTTPRLTMTRHDGTFEFVNVPPGDYTVEAGKLPHLATAQRVVLTQGQSGPHLEFRLKRSGVISGLVVDELGAPAKAASVVALRLRYERGGTLTTAAGRSTTTDRFGRFRIFGLAPGSYVVATSPAMLQVGSDSFVPGVTRAEAATVFVVDDGTEHTNVNATLAPPAAAPPAVFVPVAGRVVGSDGQPVEADVTFDYGPTPVRMAVGMRRVRTSDGQFRFTELIAGRVRLTARVPNQPLQASLDLTLSGQPVTDITLHVQPPVEIVGRTSEVGTTHIRSVTVSTHGGIGVETRTADVKDSGEFRLSLFPGNYLIESGTSVLVDGRDMTDRVIEIGHASPIRNLVVSFSESVQDISGRVTNTGGAGVSTVTMVAFSALEVDWFHQSRRIATAEPAADGRYQLGGAGPRSLPAGDYYLAAVTGLSPDEQYNPAFLRTLVGAAIKITLGAGERKVQDVRVQ